MRSRPPYGFTLIELITAMAVSVVVIAGVFLVVNSQQRAYYDGHRQRAAQAATRDALLALERIVPIAGYGMDAPLALDLDQYVVPSNRCPAEMGTCPRDATRNTDELIVLSRDPGYWTPGSYSNEPAGHAWRITGLTSSNVTINARPGDRFPAGQVLQAVCRGGGVYAYFTVGSNTPSNNAVESAQSLTIPLTAAANNDPFRQQGWATDLSFAALNGCFAGGEARLFLIQRSRFHVRPVTADDAVVPYLVLDPGVDANFDGQLDENDEVVLAEGIEGFQVTYVMNNPVLTPRGLSAGTSIDLTRRTVAAATQSTTGLTTLLFPGTVSGDPPSSQIVYAPSSFYPYSVGPPSSTERLTDHQANVVAVRIGLVARSPAPEPGAVSGELPQLLFNMDQQPSWIDSSIKFARSRVEVTLPVRNTYVRGMNDF